MILRKTSWAKGTEWSPVSGYRWFEPSIWKRALWTVTKTAMRPKTNRRIGSAERVKARSPSCWKTVRCLPPENTFTEKLKPPTKRATEITDLQRADFYRRYKNRTWLNRELKTHLSAVENFHNMVSWNDSNLMLITDRFSFEGRGEPIRDFLESKRVPVFDAGRSVMAKSSKRNKKAYLDFYPYWNKRGNQYAGFAIADYIQQNGL